MYGRVPTRPLAFGRLSPYVARVLTLAINDSDRRSVDQSKQNDTKIKVIALLLGPVDHSKEKQRNGNLSPVG